MTKKKSNDKTLPLMLVSNAQLVWASPALSQLLDQLIPIISVRDKQSTDKRIKALKSIIYSLSAAHYSGKMLTIPAKTEIYTKSEYYKKLNLGHKAVMAAKDLLTGNQLMELAFKGVKAAGFANAYRPTALLEPVLEECLYAEVDSDWESMLIVNRPTERIINEINNKYSQNGNTSNQTTIYGKHLDTEQLNCLYSGVEDDDPLVFSEAIDITDLLPEDHWQLEAMRRLNAAYKATKYPLKAPARLIYTGDYMTGGRIYMPFQRIPARRLKIRQKCLINDQPIVEVDVSANHPTMIFALFGNPEDSYGFYDAISADSGVCRDVVKEFIVRFIGTETRKTSQPEGSVAGDKAKVEKSIKQLYPEFHEHCFTGIGKMLQALDGGVMLRALTNLLDHGVVGLPLHDAIAVNTLHAELAKIAIEQAWIETFDSDFVPKISAK